MHFSTYLTNHFTYCVETQYSSRSTILILSHRFIIKPCFHNAFSVWPIHVPHGSHLLICISLLPFLGSLTQSRKAPTSFVMSVRPSVCPSFAMYQPRLPLDVFPSNLVLETFLKICRQNPNLAQIRQKYRAFSWRPKYVWLLPATFNPHKSALFEWNGIML